MSGARNQLWEPNSWFLNGKWPNSEPYKKTKLVSVFVDRQVVPVAHLSLPDASRQHIFKAYWNIRGASLTRFMPVIFKLCLRCDFEFWQEIMLRIIRFAFSDHFQELRCWKNQRFPFFKVLKQLEKSDYKSVFSRIYIIAHVGQITQNRLGNR